MCPDCEDFVRTVRLLGQTALYAETPGADLDFAETVSQSLAASLLVAPIDWLPEGYDPDSGPCEGF
ncbi:hypothetical protein [Streptomyces sp. NPDC088727]|uniref:hypothetical protein n=1 Tax=Streptomyces sp. NPDC088727 TaxID=3365875 RepID=UPI0038107D50